ncbi:ABC transporter ATP-binding protein [Aquibacillus albus]|uniref:ABC-type multidrug transport system fused ATPase/permease subunit n=1 Tax=Aquibacillus albus TaxID=1168171 RepID=A0ABS2N6Z9_9BACI|nr:ABC transporter ATP-binding protein [Aquibacillus albus]MBM7573660.1 ABC-type multidrug transport system fused ATPase/permease subunit [Aquibacillus albus]
MSMSSSAISQQQNKRDRFVYPDDRAIEKPFNWRIMVRLLHYVKPYRWTYLPVAILSLLLSTAVKLAVPFLIGYAVDYALRPQNVNLLTTLIITIAILYILQGFFNMLRIRFTTILGQNVVFDLRKKLFNHVENLSFRFFDKRTEGSIIVRLNNDVNSLQELFTNGLINIVMDLIMLFGIISMLFILNVKLTIAVMIVLPIMVLLSTKMRRKIRKGWQRVRLIQSRMNSHYNEAIQGIRETQTFVQEKENIKYFKGMNQRNTNALYQSTRLSSLLPPFVEVTGAVGTAALFWYGAHLLQAGEISIGIIVAFASYIGNFWEPISRLGNIYNQLLRAMASSERIFEFMDEKPHIKEMPDAKPLVVNQGKVTFDQVQFAYEKDRVALKEFSLHVDAGETVALVGHTGSGKTTVVNLLCRFYDPSSGRILIDHQDITKVTNASLRENISLVMQDSFLFSGTIMDNIRYGRLDATDEEVIAAAKAVHADSFIMQLPYGYQTEVEERGRMLSVGQRQLISFARALLAEPKILILDEATSSIDTETEVKIQKGMKELINNRTSFIVAHRLSTIQNADKIVVLDHGEIVEIGNHELLMAKNGVYANLVKVQNRFLEEDKGV